MINKDESTQENQYEIENEMLNTEEVMEDLTGETEVYEESVFEKLKDYLLWLIFIVVIFLLFGLFYRFYPLTSKIDGNWTGSTTNGTYVLENSSKMSTFKIKNLNNTTGMDLVFQSEIVPKDENQYVVKDTQVFLELNKDNFTSEAVNQMIGDQTITTKSFDTATKYRLKYTKKGIESLFPNESNVNNLFKYTLKDFNWKLQGNTLSLINGSFAEGGISLKRDSE